MRYLICAMSLAAIAVPLALVGTAAAQGYHYTEGYTRQNGTYVAPHYQTNPDSTAYNNWSTRGNTNPYTGQQGTRDPYPPAGNTYQRPYP